MSDIAYQAGYETAMLVKPRRNPFITGSANAANWLKGYNDGCESRKSNQLSEKSSECAEGNSINGKAPADVASLIE